VNGPRFADQAADVFRFLAPEARSVIRRLRNTAAASTLALLVAASCSRKPIQPLGVDSGTGGTPLDAQLDGQVERPARGDGRDASDEDGPASGGLVEAYDIALSASGGVAVAGRLEGAVDLGAGALVSAGGGDLLLAAFDRAGGAVWSGRFGDAANQAGSRIASDGAGNLFVAASFLGAIDLGGGTLSSAGAGDVGLARFDAAGRHLWSRRLGNQFHQEAWGAAIDSTGRSIAAITSYGPFDVSGASSSAGTSNSSSVAAFDAAGDVVWSRTWTDVLIASIAVDTSDRVLVTGSFGGAVDFGGGLLTSAGRTDLFVVVLDSGGGHRWSKRFGGTGRAVALAIATDGGGNVLLAGMFDDSFDFGGPTLVSVLGPDRFSPSSDAFVAKLDAAGNHVWSRQFGDTRDDQSASTIAADAGGNVFVAGSLTGTADFGLGTLSAPNGGRNAFVAKLDPGGTALWNLALEGNAVRVRVAPGGGVLLAGAFPVGTLAGSPVRSYRGGSNVFLVEYPP
jgi:hypothetical protein